MCILRAVAFICAPRLFTALGLLFVHSHWSGLVSGPAECMICWEHSSLPFFWEPVLKPGGFNFQQHHLLMLLKYLHTTHVSIQNLNIEESQVKLKVSVSRSAAT